MANSAAACGFQILFRIESKMFYSLPKVLGDSRYFLDSLKNTALQSVGGRLVRGGIKINCFRTDPNLQIIKPSNKSIRISWLEMLGIARF